MDTTVFFDMIVGSSGLPGAFKHVNLRVSKGKWMCANSSNYNKWGLGLAHILGVTQRVLDIGMNKVGQTKRVLVGGQPFFKIFRPTRDQVFRGSGMEKLRWVAFGERPGHSVYDELCRAGAIKDLQSPFKRRRVSQSKKKEAEAAQRKQQQYNG